MSKMVTSAKTLLYKWWEENVCSEDQIREAAMLMELLQMRDGSLTSHLNYHEISSIIDSICTH
jgi:hypothetical protein